ncbi:MAG: hypothetical protein R3F24_06065 [Gammaproteobacteria bacterium]
MCISISSHAPCWYQGRDEGYARWRFLLLSPPKLGVPEIILDHVIERVVGYVHDLYSFIEVGVLPLLQNLAATEVRINNDFAAHPLD